MTVKEEGHVCILLGLGNAQLVQALSGDILTDGVSHILLVEEDVKTLKLSIIRGHTAVVQRHCVHALLGHILLCEHYCKLLSAVVTVVEEDYNVIRFDSTDCITLSVNIHDGQHELISNTIVIRRLHSGNHVGALLAHAINKLVVSHLHTLPALIAVHGVVATDDRCNLTSRRCHMLLQRLDKALTATWVGVATIHEAVHKGVLDGVVLSDVAELEEVVER